MNLESDPYPQLPVPLIQQQQYPQPPIPQIRPLTREEQAAEYERQRRDHFQNIAYSTLQAIDNSYVDISNTLRRTQFYAPDAPQLANWRYLPRQRSRRSVNVSLAPMSTLKGVKYFYDISSSPNRIGVLNFASATTPGGGFLNGARAQEESIARSSTLHCSLTSDTAQPFYDLHRNDAVGGFYSHAMIYSPNIHIFRDDAGGWLMPHQVDVLTSPAVNAKKVRRAYRHIDSKQLERSIEGVMYERIARILALFERKSAVNLVLGSFGTGVFQNDARAMAKIWKALLLEPGARFARSFETVVFTIPDEKTRNKYERVFRTVHDPRDHHPHPSSHQHRRSEA